MELTEPRESAVSGKRAQIKRRVWRATRKNTRQKFKPDTQFQKTPNPRYTPKGNQTLIKRSTPHGMCPITGNMYLSMSTSRPQRSSVSSLHAQQQKQPPQPSVPGPTKVKDLTDRIRAPGYRAETALLPPVQAFKEFIETVPTVYEEFIRMFEGVTEAPTDHNKLLDMINDIFRKAPFYGDLGPAIYMIMAQIMNTQGGFSAFTKENLNFHFKKMFKTWATFLLSKSSRYVLVPGKFDETHYGWFSPEAKAALMAEFDAGRTFEEVFICDESQPFHGYNSYEDFFNRRFRSVEIDRPVYGGVTDLRVVGAPCESTSYNVQTDVQRSDDLFIKDEVYSLVHLLNNDPLLDQFVGGTIIQGFLNTTGYHRWHSPVNGVIEKIVDVPGTYFAQAPSTIGDPIPDNDTDLPPYLKSLQYFANTAARKLIFIQPENTDISLICFIAIGMTEISTCEATVYDGQRVLRGDELGMFHFGGSSSALFFRPDSKAQIDGKYATPGTVIKINDLIAAVNQ